MFYLKDSAQVGPGYNGTPASPHTYAAGQGGGRPRDHSLGGMHYFSVQVAQAPEAATKHHPSRR